MMQIAEFGLTAEVPRLGSADVEPSVAQCGAASAGITMAQLQVFARRGNLRIRAFGENHFYGFDRIFGGNLDLAAAALPEMFGTGMLALYRDLHGLFLGPVNSKLIDTYAEFGGDGDEDTTAQSARANMGRDS